MAQWVKNPASTHEDVGLIPGLAQWVKGSDCCKLWFRLQTWLRPGVAVAVVQAGSCSSYSALSLGTSSCCSCGRKKEGKIKQ